MSDSEIFRLAVKLPADQRSAYLDQACCDNIDLRREVESLLEAHDIPGTFLEPPSDPTKEFPPTVEKAGTVVGPYKLLQRIGEGGMGTVYMAEQTHPLRRLVALKIIKPGMESAQVIARFEAERQALALMDHPNIAKVYDAGTTDDGHPYFVMELVKGVPITQFCDENQLTIRERIELAVCVCQAIQQAHQKGVIHRDIKPSNVLVALYDDHPVPKVIDFGVAKATGENLTQRTLFTGFGALVGTLEYMSPEQARLNALDVDTRSDVYALGVLLYELLTGSTPLKRDQLKSAAFDELLRLIREEEPPRPSTRLSQSGELLSSISSKRNMEPAKLGKILRGDLDWIVMKALEKDRVRRYESAGSLARDLQRHLADEPIEACPPTAVYRLSKFVRRHCLLLSAAASLVVTLIAGLVLSTAFAFRATRAETLAKQDRDRAVAAEQIAAREKENAQATLRFLLVDVLEQADPSRRPDPDLKVRTMLDGAAKRLESATDLPDLVSASIRQTIGKSYLGLGEMSKAESQLMKSHETWKRLAGSEHLKTLDAEYYLATAYLLQSRFPETEALLRHVVAGRTRLLGIESPETLEAIHGLSALYMFQENYEAVVRLAEEPLRMAQRVAGTDHQFVTIRLMRILGNSYCESGNEASGQALLVESLRLGRSVLPRNHPDTPITMTMLAGLYLRQGRLEQAERLAREAFTIRTDLLGPLDPGTLMSQAALISALLAAEDKDEAENLLHDLLAKIERRKQDRLPVFLIEQLGHLGCSLTRRGQLTDAEIVLTLYLGIAENNQTDSWRRALAENALGTCLLKKKQYRESETLLLKSYHGLKRHESKIPAVRHGAVFVTVLETLIQFCDEVDKPADAAKWRQELTTVFPADRPSP